MNVITTIPNLAQKDDLAFSFFSPSVGQNELLVLEFTASEALFKLPEIRLELVSRNPSIDLQALLDAPATLSIHHKYLGLRHFSGIIAAVSRGDQGQRQTGYRMTILPALHRLDHGSDCRIFQEMTVPTIIKQVLVEHAIDDVKWELAHSHETREYCVQYRETHFAFIRRLAAEEGIYFYFTHEKEGKHTLVFTDESSLAKDCPEQPELEYNANPGGVVKGVFCNRFSFREELRTTSATQRDYSFKNPDYRQEHKHERQEDNGSNTTYALYDYPGRYKRDAAGKPFTRAWLESLRVDASTGRGQTNAIHLAPGTRITLTEHPEQGYNIKYLIMGASHRGNQPGALEEDAGEGATSFSTSFFVIPARLPYKPPQKSRPLVDGPQIAHVVGPAGEEIYCDEFGRIKISFPWNRYCSKDEKASCWVRVSQNWAGALWGHMAIPRIGQEVIVEFLEGDPDQPIVTGRTYDKPHLPPYKLPDNKTRMTIKSKTHKGDGFNELRFEDEAGKEEVYMHAQKDNNIDILNDRTKNVGNNQTENVSNDKALTIGNDHTESIGANMAITVADSLNETVGKINTQQVGMMKNTMVGVSWTTEVGATMATMVGNTKSTKVGRNYSISAGNNFDHTVGKDYSSNTSNDYSLSVGNNFDVSVGKNFNLTVGERLVITVGKSKLVMKKDGTIIITGTKLNTSTKGPTKLRGKVIDLN